MFSRLSQLSRHLSRPLPNLAHSSAAALRRPSPAATMTSSGDRSSRTIHTAACLVIGDEVLGGKTKDTNSNFMAKWCFGLGINFKRIEVIEDDESQIIEAVRRMSDRYDFVVTSGGIGPTHDDITYQSIAKAFSVPLELHQGALDLMKKISKPHAHQPNFNWDVDSPALRARLRMVELPFDAAKDPAKQVLFPCEELWVPVAVVNDNVHILPGVPRLFEALLEGLKPYIVGRLVDPEGKGTIRVMISTPLPESEVAGYLTKLAERAEPRGVKVGSYPRWGKKNNTVTLVGRDKEFLEEITPEVIENVQGQVIKPGCEDEVE